MLLLRLFLLVVLIRHSSSSLPTAPLTNCADMTCFVPQYCIDEAAAPSDKNQMIFILARGLVFPNCDLIAKFRSYSKKYYLVVLETYENRVSWIHFEQGTTKFECERDATETIVSLKINGVKSDKLVKSSKNPLLCEFIVQTEGEVFDSSAEIVYTTSRNDKFTLSALQFALCQPTCDPDSVKPAALGAVGDKTVSTVDVHLADLVCPAEKKLMFRKDSSSEFEDATSITCVKNGAAYEFQPKLVEAQCAVTTCTQCKSTMAPPVPNLETFDDGGCTKLRCKNGDRMKVGSADAVEGSAECKFDNNQHVWQLNGASITTDSTVACLEKKICFSSEADVKKTCKDCSLGTDFLPKCTVETATLMYQTLKMDVVCNDLTGNFTLKGTDGQVYTIENPQLHCEDKEAMEKAAAAEKQNSSTGSLALYIIIPLLVLGSLAGVGFGVWRYLQKKKQQPPPTEKKAAESTQKKIGEAKPANPGLDPLGKQVDPANKSVTDEEKQLAEQRAKIAEARRQMEEERRNMIEEAVMNKQLAPPKETDESELAGVAPEEDAPEPEPSNANFCGPQPTPAVPITGGRSKMQKK